MPCMSTPAIRCVSHPLPCGQLAPMARAAPPMRAEVSANRASRYSCRSAWGATAFPTMNPVDQIRTKMTGIRNLSIVTSMTATPHASPIQVEWAGGSQFDAGRPDGPKVRIDADARTAPGPFDMLLAAIAACAATDVVEILDK